MSRGEVDVLYEDNHLLVVNKPAGLVTMGAAPGVPSLIEQAKQYVKQRYQKPGNVYLGVVSRLDAPVTGVTVIARTSKAAARLSEQFRTRAVEKIYWALVEAAPTPASATLEDWLVSDERHRLVRLVRSSEPGAQQARLSYRTLKSLPRATWLEVLPETGRKHQIRVQLASRGWPVVGDRKYGGRQPFAAGIALHAHGVTIEHPVLHTRLEITAPAPASWAEWGVSE